MYNLLIIMILNINTTIDVEYKMETGMTAKECVERMKTSNAYFYTQHAAKDNKISHSCIAQ